MITQRASSWGSVEAKASRMAWSRAPRLPSPLGQGKEIRIGPRALAGIQVGDPPQVLGAEFEVEELEVLLDPRGACRLRDDHVAQLDVPAQHDLGRGPRELLGDVDD